MYLRIGWLPVEATGATQLCSTCLSFPSRLAPVSSHGDCGGTRDLTPYQQLFTITATMSDCPKHITREHRGLRV